MGYQLRTLNNKDISKIYLTNELDRILGVPARYCLEEPDWNWCLRYTKNYGNAIRCSIVDKIENILGLVTLTDINFFQKTAKLHIYIKESDSFSVKRFALSKMLKHAIGSLRLREIFYEDNISEDFWLEEIGFLKYGRRGDRGYYLFRRKPYYMTEVSDDNNIPPYCIEPIYISEEKQYILNYFDKDMFYPISQNIEYNNIVMNIITAADMFLAYNTELLGFAALYANNVRTREAYISIIVVSKGHQRKGIGHALMDACKELAVMRGMNYIKLEVDKKNQSAIDFYLSIGFQKTGEKSEKGFYLILPCGKCKSEKERSEK